MFSYDDKRPQAIKLLQLMPFNEPVTLDWGMQQQNFNFSNKNQVAVLMEILIKEKYVIKRKDFNEPMKYICIKKFSKNFFKIL